MNRRHFLAATLTLAGATLLFSGCGGVSGSGGTGTLAEVAGRAILPPGATAVGGTVQTPFGSQTVRPDSTFPVAILDGGPTLAVLYGATGKPLLFGFAKTGSADLSPRTTAEVMAFLACGAPCLPSELQPLYLTELARADRLVGLERAISDLLAAKGEAWLDTPDAGLTAALNADIKPFLSQRTRGVIVDPTDVVSGIQVESDSLGSTTITNFFRRRAYVYIDRESYTDTNKVEHPSFATLTTEPISLSPTKGQTSTLPVIFDWLTGNNDAYLPVKSDPVSLPLAPSDARSTLYTVTAVGLGGSPGAFDKLTTERQNAWVDSALRTLVIDLVIPAITGLILPQKSVKKWLEDVADSAWLKDLISTVTALPDLVTKVKSGQYAEAGKDIKFFIVGTERFKSGLLELLEIFVAKLGPTAGAAAFTAMSAAVDKLLFAPDLFVQAFDTVVQLIGIARAQNATQWQVTVTKAKVSLDPQEIIVEKNTQFSGIKVKVTDAQADAGSAFAYSWKCGKSKLSDGIKFQQVIESSSSDSVLYDGAVPGGTVDQLDVQVFLKGLGKLEPVGSASAKVYVTELTVTPTTKTLKANETVALTAELKGMRPLKPGETLTYKWLTTRNAGELLGSSDGGTVIPVEGTSATYRAHATKQGQDTVTVEAFLGSVRIASAKAKVTVGSNILTVAGRWFVEVKAAEGSPGFTWVRALLMVPKVEGAKSYSVYCHDFNDTAYYGTSLRRGWTMPLPSDWADFGSEYAFGLSGGQSRDPDVAGAVAYLTARFTGMIVDVTVTL